MSNKLGRFEILSEIARSTVGAVYKANDTESSQTVALKTLQLDSIGEQAADLVKRIQEEVEAAKVLNSHNIAIVNQVGEFDRTFFASLEYVQGNSIATMLARNEGFSIWDLLDIARQTCQGLDHAHTKGVFHYSLEPAKIMVTWDGTVKVLGFGISSMSALAAQSSGPAPLVLHYMSPEQIHADPLDSRSNLFSLGAILYEMVTERKAFDGEDAEQVRRQILEQMPAPPSHLSPKVHPALNEVIMKALAKAPEERYQSGQELVNDLEKCKESSTKAAAKAAPAPQGLGVQAANRPVQGAKPSTPPVAAKPPATKPVAPPPPVARTAMAPAVKPPTIPAASAPEQTAPKPAAAAAAAAAAAGGSSTSSLPKTPKLDPTSQFISNCVKASVEAAAGEQPSMSAVVIEPEMEAPKITVDPMMDESRAASAPPTRSFSEIDELPPLKEVFVAPDPPAPAEPEVVPAVKQPLELRLPQEEKPRTPPRELAKKAVKEVQKTPPKLFMYCIAAAMAVMLLVMVGIMFHIRNENTDEDTGPTLTTAPAEKPTPPAPAPPPAAAPAPAQEQAVAVPAPPVEETPVVSIKPKSTARKKGARNPAPAPAPAIIPGMLNVSSTPAGAQVRVDGNADPTWVTPYNLTNLSPGQHSVTVSKAGFASESRTIDIASGGRSALVVQLVALTATASVTSDPGGAEILLDGKNTGHITPASIVVDKAGTHTITVSKQGYLDETTTANLQFGQVLRYSPALRKLGNTDDIKSVSKFKKVFGGGDAAGMGMVSIKTNPKGAQIAINRRIYEKQSPVNIYLNPGTYMLDLTLSGFKDVHKVINVEKDGKVAIEEIMERE